MINYTKTTWAERIGTKLNRFKKTNETSTHVELTNEPETVTENGQPFSVAAMTNLESQMLAVSTEIYNALVAGGVTPSGSVFDQLKTLLQKGSGSTIDGDKLRGVTPGAWALAYLALSTQATWSAKLLSDLLTVDGVGSGLDANYLGGLLSTAFGRRVTGVTNMDTISEDGVFFITAASPTGNPGDGTYFAGIQLNINSDSGYKSQLIWTNTGRLYTRRSLGGTWGGYQLFWTNGNDGAGSGLDADLVRGTTPGTRGLTALASATTLDADTVANLAPDVNFYTTEQTSKCLPQVSYWNPGSSSTMGAIKLGETRFIIGNTVTNLTVTLPTGSGQGFCIEYSGVIAYRAAGSSFTIPSANPVNIGKVTRIYQ